MKKDELTRICGNAEARICILSMYIVISKTGNVYAYGSIAAIHERERLVNKIRAKPHNCASKSTMDRQHNILA